MAFPNKLREQMGESFIITIGLDGCLFVYSGYEWEIFTSKIKSLTGEKAKAGMMFIRYACLVSPDKQGRILIPQNLRERASLEKEVAVTGAITHAEIWNADKFRAYDEAFDNEALSKAVEDIAL